MIHLRKPCQPTNQILGAGKHGEFMAEERETTRQGSWEYGVQFKGVGLEYQEKHDLAAKMQNVPVEKVGFSATILKMLGSNHR